MKPVNSHSQTRKHTSNRPPKVEHLEDRLVPGETLTGLLLMPMGLSPLQDFWTHQSSVALNASSLAITDSSNAAAKPDALFLDTDGSDLVSQSGLTLFFDRGLDQNQTQSRVSTSPPTPYPSRDEIFANSSATIDLSGRILDLSPFAPERQARHISAIADNVPSSVNPGAGASVTTISSAGATAISELAPPAAGSVSSGASGAGAAVAGGTAEAMLKVKPQATTSPAGYSPAQISHAYGIDQLSQNGAGMTIAIVDAYDDPNALSDLQNFDATFGLPNPNFTKATPQGKPKANQGWALEISLDVQWAHAIAPYANILLVEARSNSFSNLLGAVDYAVSQGVQVVSMSWSGNEFSSETSYDSHFNNSRVAFFAASGDTGGTVGYPSVSPYVVSVGGTTLPLDRSGTRTAAESAWSSGGGGPSAYESEPGYQTNYGITITGGKRGTPDVAMDADPNTGVSVYDSYGYFGQKGWFVVGGTSLSAPMWAGVVALADQSRVAGSLSSANLTSRFDYSAATGTSYKSNYYDITTGSNGYSATTGYDLATGVGTPLANNLVPYLQSH